MYDEIYVLERSGEGGVEHECRFAPPRTPLWALAAGGAPAATAPSESLEGPATAAGHLKASKMWCKHRGGSPLNAGIPLPPGRRFDAFGPQVTLAGNQGGTSHGRKKRPPVCRH
jgi:hypothetical protein